MAVERGLVDLDEPAGPSGPPASTVRHLLAHTSGWAFDGEATLAAPGSRRIYSNTGVRPARGARRGTRRSSAFEAVLGAWILEPLGMTSTRLVERPSQGLHGPLDDMARFAGELLRPRLVSGATAAIATAVAFPGLKGVVPGVGNYDPCDWGLGPELHDGKRPHWMGESNSPATFGHFGGSGTFVWVDPVGRPRPGRAHGPRVRTVGARGVAAVLGRGASGRRGDRSGGGRRRFRAARAPSAGAAPPRFG